MTLDKSSIERLKKRLYSRSADEMEQNEASGVSTRRRLRELSYNDASTVWQEDAPKPHHAYNRDKILKYILGGAALFFMLSLAVSAFLLTQNASLSPKKVKIEVQGPAAIAGGEKLTLQMLVRNDNTAAIEEAELVIEFPPGTRSATDLETELPRLREPLGTLQAGGEIRKTVRAVFFGEENSEQVVTFYVEYRVVGSSATFSSQEQHYPLVLTSAPISVLVDVVTEITSGQLLEFNLTIISNSDTELKDVILSAEYPFGFVFEKASPKPAFRNGVWELGDIKPEQKKTVTLSGRITGENADERIFRFAAGSRSARNETELGTAFMTVLRSVFIQKPFIGVEFAVNGSTGSQPTVTRGEHVRGDITWFNNLPSRIYDAKITVDLSGEGIDKRTISAPKGFYRSSDDTITWTSDTDENLQELGDGDRGVVTFTFETLDITEGTLREPAIHASIDIEGKRLSENNVPEIIRSSIARTIKIASDLTLASRVVYFAGPFKNEGPLPPETNTKTTYTVLWTVTNSSNGVSGVTVEAALPSYVRFLNKFEPSSAEVTYSQVGGRVTWSVGTLAPGARKDVAFQIELEPSLSQVGFSPVLVGEQTVRGIDNFTSTTVGASRPSLTTWLTTDPEFDKGQDLIVE